MDDRIADDARFALLAKVRQARMMSARAKLFAGSELFDEACAWNYAGITAQNPGSSEADKRKELQRRLKLGDRLSDDDHDRMRFDRRVRQTIFPGVDVSLPTAEDVIIQKLRWSRGAKRPKDYADTVAVMQVQGKSLDWPYIEHWCALHDTLNVLTEARAEATVVWEEDERENAPE